MVDIQKKEPLKYRFKKSKEKKIHLKFSNSNTIKNYFNQKDKLQENSNIYYNKLLVLFYESMGKELQEEKESLKLKQEKSKIFQNCFSLDNDIYLNFEVLNLFIFCEKNDQCLYLSENALEHILKNSFYFM